MLSCAGKVMLRFGVSRLRPDGLFREARGEVVEAQRALDGPAIDRPAILRIEAEIVVEIGVDAKRERALGDQVRHAAG